MNKIFNYLKKSKAIKINKALVMKNSNFVSIMTNTVLLIINQMKMDNKNMDKMANKQMKKP
jgi:hypothetical protein